MKIWKALFYLILIIFPFGQLLGFKLAFLPASVRVQPIDIACFIFLIYWLFFFKRKSQIPFFIKSALVFLFIAFLSLAIKLFTLPFDELIPAFFYLLRLWCYFFLPWAFFDFFKHFKVRIYELLIYEGVAIAGLSILQYLFLPDTRFLLIFGWDDHLFRAIGPFLDPSFNGLILILSSIILWFNFLIAYFAGGIVLTIAIGLSFSRMNYLLFVISSIIIFLIKRKFKTLLILLLFFVGIIMSFPKPTGEGVDLLRTSTTFAKLSNYKMVISIIKDNFWTGVGFNAIRGELFKRGYLNPIDWQESHSGAGADNSFLLVFATTGIFGFLSYLYYWFSILKEKNIIFITTSICLLLSAFFINSLFYPWILCWWGMILAFTAEKST